jgi:hypothetical protein
MDIVSQAVSLVPQVERSRSLESVRGLANPARPGLIDSKKKQAYVAKLDRETGQANFHPHYTLYIPNLLFIN